ncbi:YfcC family protein [Geosporobacter ferrireducens]|uniref:C4-dicarboxylate ABC transporter permease n=1 Tax=Geosporobacter ferrireducens TaxID=1424294 RepID=A0A1D8GFC2_9FIRM|nr:AbgT family transporter [Geosporobacter ferrireducens]AOT69607.1 C4-dicarboxylate ABC transporter permease [Geosporobacter ferrireducens]MTI54695.1 putative basic amino acid antiporter YfcC [Geosporobacter ferrireducens]
MSNQATSAKKSRVPHTFVILIGLAFLMLLLTYVIPAGEYDRVKDAISGKTVIDPNSFHYVEQAPVSVFKFPLAIYNAIVKAANISVFIFIIGGAFEIINSTGALNVFISKAAKSFANRERLLIPLLMTVFSVGGFTFGMSVENIVFIPTIMALMMSLGYDAVTGMAVVSLGAACGFISGILNPFNVGVAQAIAGLPMFSGAWFRVIVLVGFLIITSLYVMRYASKVKENPLNSVVSDLNEWEDIENGLHDIRSAASVQDYVILFTVLIGFAAIVFGVLKYEWFIAELAALFLTMGIVAGIINGYGANKIAGLFCIGLKNVAVGALIIGVARTISVIMEDGQIIDTVVYGLSTPLGRLPGSLQAVGMYFAHTLINIPITSGSGQAAATMPIMLPLSEVIGLSKQTAVLTFQLGDGITNNILPTSSALMAALSVAKIPYEKWIKFAGPLMGIWILYGMALSIIASIINY